jgi:hypothetical protein
MAMPSIEQGKHGGAATIGEAAPAARIKADLATLLVDHTGLNRREARALVDFVS